MSVRGASNKREREVQGEIRAHVDLPTQAASPGCQSSQVCQYINTGSSTIARKVPGKGRPVLPCAAACNVQPAPPPRAIGACEGEGGRRVVAHLCR